MPSVEAVQSLRVRLPKRRQSTRRGQGRVEVVLPTVELLRHKSEVLGGHVGDNGQAVGFDGHASVWPLDVYLARSVIDARQHRAGCLYARLRYSLYGPCWPHCGAFWREVVSEHIGDEDGPPLEELTDGERLDLEFARTRRLRDATNVLRRKGVWWIVRVVVLDGNFIQYTEERSLRLGLELLAQRWRIKDDGQA